MRPHGTRVRKSVSQHLITGMRSDLLTPHVPEAMPKPRIFSECTSIKTEKGVDATSNPRPRSRNICKHRRGHRRSGGRTQVPRCSTTCHSPGSAFKKAKESGGCASWRDNRLLEYGTSSRAVVLKTHRRRSEAWGHRGGYPRRAHAHAAGLGQALHTPICPSEFIDRLAHPNKHPAGRGMAINMACARGAWDGCVDPVRLAIYRRRSCPGLGHT